MAPCTCEYHESIKWLANYYELTRPCNGGQYQDTYGLGDNIKCEMRDCVVCGSTLGRFVRIEHATGAVEVLSQDEQLCLLREAA